MDTVSCRECGYEQDRLVDNPVGPSARVADVTRDRVAWCDDAALLADTQLALGALFGDWTVDRCQFFGWNHVPHVAGAPANLHRWAGGAAIEQVAVGEYGIRGVYDFVAIPSQTVEEVFAPAPMDPEA